MYTCVVSTTIMPMTLTVISGMSRACFQLVAPADDILEEDEAFAIILTTDVTAITLDPSSINVIVEDASSAYGH